ncbi:MAG: 4Fe-4S binding protein [archaeon]|nr:4Fe-4S binding protein [archaeon]
MTWSYSRTVCVNCGACVAVCPVNCLELGNYELSCSNACIDCKVCERMCPVGAITVAKEKEGETIPIGNLVQQPKNKV